MPMLSLAQLTLTVEINNIRNNKGQIHLELSNEREVSLIGLTKNISGNKCVFVVENLKPGKYSFKFIHDENMNETLDVNWFGIPTEGFGFSNNPSMTFGPPSFEKTIFELKESTTIKCKPKYYKAEWIIRISNLWLNKKCKL
ncbi:MAG: DUF2141 domain-containing protein [Bacteroidetes bacterium]|nr:DUF2141 domain-containing protein [Bacteroidota bacterium]